MRKLPRTETFAPAKRASKVRRLQAIDTSSPICGLWADGAGRVHIATAQKDGGRTEAIEPLKPFVWLDAELAPRPGVSVEVLAGSEKFSRLAHAESADAYSSFLKGIPEEISTDAIRPLESQYLLQRRRRLFEGLPFTALRRCQLAIELGGEDAARRVSAVGILVGDREQIFTATGADDASEKSLLEAFSAALSAADPDVVEGHGLFRLELEFLRDRCRTLKVGCTWGRFGQKPSIRSARLKAAEKWIDFRRCDLPGRAVVDTFLLVQLYDITAREMSGYELADCAAFFELAEAGVAVHSLSAQLRHVRALADLLLPTYFEQAKTFPITFQEATLKGQTGKIDLLFLEHYYHARHSCPQPPEIAPFEGGYTKSFEEGVFHHVLHFDVASLYPSLLLAMNRNPRNDPLGAFIPMLRTLRQYRMKYKDLARNSREPAERAEAQARQASFKILINSFYGYLGFSGARFGDGELAAEVTRQGRELLQKLIDEFTRHGCRILEADTDGIYLSSEKYYDAPAELLKLAAHVLPAGIELEFDGKYPAMFCYKAKNYALYDGREIVRRGSAFRSRSVEPYLQQITDAMLRFLLGASADSPLALAEDYRRRLVAAAVPVEEVAKSETLSQPPEAYERFVAEGGKPRRASGEVALLTTPRPRMGDRVTYYVTSRTKTRTSDWQRARPVAAYDKLSAPYDASYYIDKIDDWLERYGKYLGATKSPEASQGELF